MCVITNGELYPGLVVRAPTSNELTEQTTCLNSAAIFHLLLCTAGGPAARPASSQDNLLCVCVYVLDAQLINNVFTSPYNIVPRIQGNATCHWKTLKRDHFPQYLLMETDSLHNRGIIIQQQRDGVKV